MTATIQGCSQSPVNEEVNEQRSGDDDERIERERFLSDNTGTGEPESHWLCSPDMSIFF